MECSLGQWIAASAHDDTKCAARRLRPPFHLSRQDLQRLRLSFDVRERRGVGARHPSLRADALQLRVERGPPQRIEMSDYLVQQQYRCKARHFGKQPRVRQNETDEQRL